NSKSKLWTWPFLTACVNTDSFHFEFSGWSVSGGRITCRITTALLQPHEVLRPSGVGSGQRHQERSSDERRACHAASAFFCNHGSNVACSPRSFMNRAIHRTPIPLKPPPSPFSPAAGRYPSLQSSFIVKSAASRASLV